MTAARLVLLSPNPCARQEGEQRLDPVARSWSASPSALHRVLEEVPDEGLSGLLHVPEFLGILGKG
ncbi:hypothetical protein MDA_GLEAN10020959 [Myotis davidii]|uniref:Uncharacterized protein n=1 Tax=Myotis davidii TaxID=225400 RepID=L5M490_MYODS|nr:hypothetical protein MDA_GLEAN10020959 [Myotis davidii]